MNTNEYLYTRKQVKELVEATYIGLRIREEVFDMYEQLHPKINKDWEVMEFIGSVNGYFGYESYNGVFTNKEKWQEFFISAKYSIRSVKRLPDNEIFYVGSKYKGCPICNIHTIKSFEIDNEDLVVKREDGRIIDFQRIIPQPTQEVFTWYEVAEIISSIKDGAMGYDTKKYLNNKFHELKASKTNTVKEERYFDCESDKGVKFFQDEAPKFRQQEPSKPRISVTHVTETNGMEYFQFKIEGDMFSIPSEKLLLIKSAIKNVLNDEKSLAARIWDDLSKKVKAPYMISYSKEISEFIEQNFMSVNREWFTASVWYQKLGDNIWRTWTFKDLPSGVRKEILSLSGEHDITDITYELDDDPPNEVLSVSVKGEKFFSEYEMNRRIREAFKASRERRYDLPFEEYRFKNHRDYLSKKKDSGEK